MLKEQTTALLKSLYSRLDDGKSVKPLKNYKAKWNESNTYGFLLGIIEYGEEQDIITLNQKLKETVSITDVEFIKTINDLYTIYVYPFHQDCSKRHPILILLHQRNQKSIFAILCCLLVIKDH